MLNDEFKSMINDEEDTFDGILPGDLSPIEAERVSAVGKVSTLWEDSV